MKELIRDQKKSPMSFRKIEISSIIKLTDIKNNKKKINVKKLFLLSFFVLNLLSFIKLIIISSNIKKPSFKTLTFFFLQI